MSSVLVILMGIPGSGKSTIADQLLSNKEATNVQLVSYDDLYDELRDNETLKVIDNVFDQDTWHKSRIEALGRASAILQREKDGKSSSSLDRSVVVVDDTFHYKSMRKEVARIARNTFSGLVTVWVDAPLDVCLQRNGLRESHRRVPDESLRTVFNQLEPPIKQSPRNTCHNNNPSKLFDESCSLKMTFDHEEEEAADDQVGRWIENGGAVVRIDTTENSLSEPPMFDLSIVWNAIMEAKENPLKPIETSEEASAASRLITSASVLHSGDLVLRKCVAEAMQALQPILKTQNKGKVGSFNNGETSRGGGGGSFKVEQSSITATQLAALMNEERKLLLSELRLGTLPLESLDLDDTSVIQIDEEKSNVREKELLAALLPSRFFRRCICQVERIGKQTNTDHKDLCSALRNILIS